MFPASDDFIMTQERSSFFDIPRSAIISQHLSLSESFWCVYKTKKEIEKGIDEINLNYKNQLSFTDTLKCISFRK